MGHLGHRHRRRRIVLALITAAAAAYVASLAVGRPVTGPEPAIAILTAGGQDAGPPGRDSRLTDPSIPQRVPAREIPAGSIASWLAFDDLEETGVSGIATLWTEGEATHVSIQLVGDGVVGRHPTHIHTGTCADLDPDPTASMTTIVLDEVNEQGLSETTVGEITLDALGADDYVILVHKSSDEIAESLVCGEIKGWSWTLPSTGTGSSLGLAGPMATLSRILAALAALIASLAVGSLVLPRRRFRE